MPILRVQAHGKSPRNATASRAGNPDTPRANPVCCWIGNGYLGQWVNGPNSRPVPIHNELPVDSGEPRRVVDSSEINESLQVGPLSAALLVAGWV